MRRRLIKNLGAIVEKDLLPIREEVERSPRRNRENTEKRKKSSFRDTLNSNADGQLKVL